jgi:hypothetical protein
MKEKQHVKLLLRRYGVVIAKKFLRIFSPLMVAPLVFVFTWQDAAAASASRAGLNAAGDLWSRDNFVAWEVAPNDVTVGPEERAQILENLHLKQFAYDWHAKDIPTLDAQIESLQGRGIRQLAWWFPFDGEDPVAEAALDAIKRHGIHPQLWVPNANFYFVPRTPEGWAPLLPKGFTVPKTKKEWTHLSPEDHAVVQRVIDRLKEGNPNFNLPKTPQEQEQRVKQEANRINTLVKMAAPSGSSIELYNHGGWFGIMENELAVIDRLNKMGVTGVGIVYSFGHARDEFHDDTKNFPEIWRKIKAHVVAINVTGVRWEGQLVYPTQGDGELEMMRTIQESGWTGPVVVSADDDGEVTHAEATLRNYLAGIDWLAAELRQPGSGGPRPVLHEP